MSELKMEILVEESFVSAYQDAAEQGITVNLDGDVDPILLINEFEDNVVMDDTTIYIG